MKKTICLLLSCILLTSLSLCACGNSQPENGDTPFQVGYGKVDITPAGSVALLGYSLQPGETRNSDGILDKLFFTCVAVTDTQNNTVLICTVDLIFIDVADISAIGSRVQEKFGIPKENLVISATHAHSTPQCSSIKGFYDMCVDAIGMALEDRAPVTIEAGSTRTEGMNYVRHYICEDGTVAGDNFGTGSPRAKHTTEADNEMQLIRFHREADKKDILMVNWQAHAKTATTSETSLGRQNRTKISADFVGFVRSYVEAKGYNFAYYSGASGNLNTFGALNGERNLISVNDLGKALGQVIDNALANLQTVETGSVLISHKPVEVTGKRGTEAIDIMTVKVGSLAFVALPYEVFDTNGMQIKDGSDCETTFILSIANGLYGYIPSEQVWDYDTGSTDRPYEEAECGYARGTGEKIAQEAIELLNGMGK